MIESGGDGDLAQESLGANRGGQVGPHDFDRDRPRVAEVLREPHRGHAALSELAIDAVPARERRLQTIGQAHGFGIVCSPLISHKFVVFLTLA